ncbi:hypothetical protein [Bremerella cremea]|uniref:hypothetical protein n=1 Tax=Bremerella cremea TaxID=1031537 RepID=UPI0031F11EE5
MYRRHCQCCYTPNKPCVSVTGSWAAASGTWSPVVGGAKCTSPGAFLYSPASGLDSGDRQGMQLQITGSDAFIAGWIFDADDEANCHRLKITKTSSDVTAELEQVTSGSAVTLDAWDMPQLAAFSGFSAASAEYANYVTLSAILDSSLNAITGWGCGFPRDGSYQKRGGPKLGFFAESFDGGSLTMVRYPAGSLSPHDGYYGRNTCAGAMPGFCSFGVAGFDNTAIIKFGGTDQVYYELDVSGLSLTSDSCSEDEAFWLSGNIDWNPGSAGSIQCSYQNAAPKVCTGGDWQIETSVIFTTNLPYADENLRRDIAQLELTVIYRRAFNSSVREYRFRGYVQQDSFTAGQPITLPLYSESISGAEKPFNGTPTKATLTCV